MNCTLISRCPSGGLWMRIAVWQWLSASLVISSSCADPPLPKTKDPVSMARVSAAELVLAGSRYSRVSMYADARESHRLNASKAADLRAKLTRQTQDEVLRLQTLITLDRLEGRPYTNLLARARQLAIARQRSNSGASIPISTQLDLAVSALSERRWGALAHYLFSLDSAKDRSAKSHAQNIRGIAAQSQGLYPRALEHFKRALTIDSSNTAARVNRAFLMLRFAHGQRSAKDIRSLDQDWFVRSALVSGARITGQTAKARSLCSELVAQRPEHKSILFNCGLVHFQNAKDPKTALELIERAQRLQGAKGLWGRRAKHYLSILRS